MLAGQKKAGPRLATGNFDALNRLLLRLGPVLLLPLRLALFLWMHLRRTILGRCGLGPLLLSRCSLLALLLPVAELVFIVPGLSCVPLLHRRCRLGLGM